MYNRQKVDNYELHKAWNIHLHKLLMAKAQQFHIDLDKRSASSTTLAIILIFYLLISKSGLNLNTGGEKTHTLRQLEGCHKLLNLKPIWCMQFQTRQFFILSIKFHKCQGMASIGEIRDNSTILSHYYSKEKKNYTKYIEKKKRKSLAMTKQDQYIELYNLLSYEKDPQMPMLCFLHWDIWLNDLLEYSQKSLEI